ncbi:MULTISPECIES: LysR family transcriptional regulator [unclassified Micromonospora]|uniref:LysR family transcriptional regulator n=1 Tax=unclassified Micromonospora TaxID=2617518 RepID=UPI002FF1E2F3
MDLEIRHLRVVCAIADTGSISKAASRLGISQPSVTTLLQRVERMVGHQIFQRGRGGARSTTFGEQFLQRARLLVAEMDALRGNIAGPAGTIRFGSVHMECVSSLFHCLETSFPDISFSMCVEPSSLRLAQRLVHGDLDVAVLAIAESHQIPLPQELGERVLASAIPVYVAVSSAHRAAGLREIPLEGLKKRHGSGRPAERTVPCPPSGRRPARQASPRESSSTCPAAAGGSSSAPDAPFSWWSRPPMAVRESQSFPSPGNRCACTSRSGGIAVA